MDNDDSPVVQTKVCNGCKQVKPLSEFGKEAKGKFGVKSKCRLCIAEKNKSYAQSSHGAEALSAARQLYRDNHRDQLAEKAKQARLDDKMSKLTPQQLRMLEGLKRLADENKK
ncbi:hypothetical protein [Serratia fonticola]